MISCKHNNEGFALLISVIVTSIVLAIGLSILDLTLKELRLSTLSEGSEEAFHAANAGVECARYWRNTADDDDNGLNDFEDGRDVTIECFGGGQTGSDADSVPVDSVASEAAAWRYTFTQDWQAGVDRCSEIDLIVIISGDGVNEATGLPRNESATVDRNDVPESYPDTTDIVCPTGGLCTLAFVQGYNISCPNPGDPFPRGTLQREVLLRF